MVSFSIIPFDKTVNIPAQNFSLKGQGSEIRFSLEKRPQCKHISQCASVKSNNAVLPSGAYFIQHRYLYIQQRYEWREMKKKLWFVPSLQFIYEESDSYSCPLTPTDLVDFEAAETDQELLDNSWSEISMEERKDCVDSYRKSSGSFVEIDGDQTNVLPTVDCSKYIRREKKTKVLKYKHLKKKIKKFHAFCK
ncbi:hypothetical protein AVEN_237051-1 [Araneus ventricosus]|uniref:Uncharacterized protein n=1 Tax=Araneus ventricosus TaxID=182803 RepID=A0A4Y2PEX8_ARAVE|nr:hypothetical protein AVEN_237051-1 [Araneus ventricosus]